MLAIKRDKKIKKIPTLYTIIYLLSSHYYFPFEVMSHSAFSTFDLMTVRLYLPFIVVSFRPFVPYSVFSVDYLSTSTFFFTIGVFSVNLPYRVKFNYPKYQMSCVSPERTPNIWKWKRKGVHVHKRNITDLFFSHPFTHFHDGVHWLRLQKYCWKKKLTNNF
jgi:hypothetical protein